MNTTTLNSITKKQSRALLAQTAADIAQTIKKREVVVAWFVQWCSAQHSTTFTASDLTRITNKTYQGNISLQKANSIRKFLELYLEERDNQPATLDNTDVLDS